MPRPRGLWHVLFGIIMVGTYVQGVPARGQTTPPKRHTALPNVTVLAEDFAMPQLQRTRRVWVYLPTDYATTQHRYPVLYLHDGQNVFDEYTSFAGEWGVDETLSQLQAQKQDRGCIVVAIDNGGDNRLNEYSPWRNPKYGGGEGEAYARFLVETLKPYIDAHYRTLTGRAYTGIAGSSMGALISVYAALRYPQAFSKVGVFSPAFWFAKDSLDSYIRQATPRLPTRFYFVAGEQESPTMVPYMAEVRNLLRDTGSLPTDLNYATRPDGKHSEWFWRREFPAAYQWLYRPADVAGTLAAVPPLRYAAYLSPDQQHLVVQLPPEVRKARLRIEDATGRSIVTQKVRNGATVAVAALAPGNYTLFIDGGRDVGSGQQLLHKFANK